MTAQAQISIARYFGLFAVTYTTLMTLRIIFPALNLFGVYISDAGIVIISACGVSSVFAAKHERAFTTAEYWKLVFASIIVVVVWAMVATKLWIVDLSAADLLTVLVISVSLQVGLLFIVYSGMGVAMRLRFKGSGVFS